MRKMLKSLLKCLMIIGIASCASVKPKRPEISFWRPDLKDKKLVNHKKGKIDLLSEKFYGFSCMQKEDLKALMEYVIRLESKYGE